MTTPSFMLRSALVAALLGAATVQAQELDTSRLQVLDDDRSDLGYQDIPFTRLEDMDVSREGRVIGEVEEILGDASGEAVALVVEFEDEVMGGDDREVIIPLDELQVNAQDNRLETTLSDEELMALTPWGR